MQAYQRLLNYVKVHTTSDPHSITNPSTPEQFALAEQLAAELKAIGLDDAHMSEKCFVYATLPATPGHENAPALGLIAHMDTSPDASGKDVRPLLHKNYDGEKIYLPNGDIVLSLEQFPSLRKLKGQTLITADGSTLLGADDKAGIAEIITALERIISEGHPHCRLCIAFTPDEEIGHGVEGFDIAGFDAAYAYTVDGGDVGEIEYENFNAATATVICHGCLVHPGTAKNIMVNAQNVAIEFHTALPAFERPEHTQGREGFYHLTNMTGDVGTAKLSYIIRDHDAANFAQRKTAMEHIAHCINNQYGPDTIEVTLQDSYYNMLEKIRPHFHLIENARTAIHMLGLAPIENPIRGGTDGAKLSYQGLPCPNLGTGGFNAHGPYEYITAEKMEQAVQILLNIVNLYQ